MNIQLAKRVQSIQPSPTFALSAKANKLKAEGKDIINLTIGEPDFDTPEHIKEAARQALRDGFTKYTAVDGIASLKQAVIHKFATENQLTYEPKQVMVSNGVKQCLFNLTQALLNPGDEVILLGPYWVSYADIALIAEAKPVVITTTIDQHFKVSPEQLEAAITPKTRLIIFNSPSNPSGMTYSKQELHALGQVLLRHPNIVIISDDMYEHILWTPEPFVNILNACPELYDRTVVMNGVSKAYAMTGWRIGYAGGPAKLIASMVTVQSQSTSNANSIAQVAAQIALLSDQTSVREMSAAYKQRHEIIYQGFRTIKGVQCLPSDGTFYFFPSMQEILQTSSLKTDMALADYLLNVANVAVIPGSVFGAPGCLRFSFVVSTELLKTAVKRVQTALAELK